MLNNALIENQQRSDKTIFKFGDANLIDRLASNRKSGGTGFLRDSRPNSDRNSSHYNSCKIQSNNDFIICSSKIKRSNL